MLNVEKILDKLLMLVNGVTKLNGSVNEIKEKYSKKRIYLEGNFNNSELKSFIGVKNINVIFPGFIFEFDTEKMLTSL